MVHWKYPMGSCAREARSTVADAIRELPPLQAGETDEEDSLQHAADPCVSIIKP